jgi:hypothetical protein
VVSLPLPKTRSHSSPLSTTATPNTFAACRILLVSQNYQPSELLEWCSNKQLTAAMAELQGSSNAQQAAMRRGMALHTQQLQPQ